MHLQFINTRVELLPEKALYLPDRHTLIIADLHLGKAMHFRKSGIPIPPQSAGKDYLKLHQLIQKTHPEKIIIIGDLFHSRHNSEWNFFCEFVNDHPGIDFTLVIGNHDIMERSHYEKICLQVIEDTIILDDLVLSHEPLENVPEGKINIAGHIHPGFVMRGRGLQSIKLPCFYRLPQLLILPAFGSLTGLYVLGREENAEVYVVVGEKVLQV